MTSTTSRPATAPVTIDSDRWPDVAAAAGSPARAAIARALFSNAVTRLPIRVATPDGKMHGAGGPNAPVMVLHRPREFFRRFGASGLIGFGEAYMAGDWDCADLTGLLTVFAAHATELIPSWLQTLRGLAVRRQPVADDQTVSGAQRNIQRHYDLSNDLFALFLDETMTYSSALFGTGPDGVPVASAAGLPDAQRRKIDRLLDRAGVGPGVKVLEIGTGWGELALRAGRRGADVLSITISREQAELARRRIADAGLADRVHVGLRDYRDIEGRFDAICSVEMLEAVGERYWDAYFTALDQHLAPGGRIGLQTITMGHERMLATRRTYTWIHKYIFPGGLLPSVTGIGDSLARSSWLHITEREDFGAHYAETLRIWREQFAARSEEVSRLGFDEVFKRMWNFYLSYSEAGFRAGYIGVSQLTLARI
ncbi:MAG: cyclopropane-fatty-acyl-phospholipid synthase family protein [Streptosporangiaceae bacterium]